MHSAFFIVANMHPFPSEKCDLRYIFHIHSIDFTSKNINMSWIALHLPQHWKLSEGAIAFLTS